MRVQGTKAVGVLISAVVIFLAALTLYFINAQILADQNRTSDIKHMRQLYVAAYAYESLNDGLPPPDLSLDRNAVDGAETFLASQDPFKEGAEFPADPAFPDAAGQSYRISFTYLPQWVLHDRCVIPDWLSATQNSSLGLIACYWNGSASRRDGLDSKGSLLRLNMDGSAHVVPVPDGAALLDAKSLFGIR